MDRYHESKINDYKALVRAYRGYIRGISNNNKTGIEVNKNMIKKLEARLDMSPKYFGESSDGGSSKAELYKLYTKAMKIPSGSPAHNELKDKIAKLRKELGMNESISKADILEYMEDAMSGTLELIENTELVYSHKKALIESVDILTKEYEKLMDDNTLTESIQLNEFVPLAALAAPVLGTVARAATGAAIRGGVRYLGSRAAKRAAAQGAKKVAQRGTKKTMRQRAKRMARKVSPEFGSGSNPSRQDFSKSGGDNLDPTAAAYKAGLSATDIAKVQKGYKK
jgi:hypothetical protein